MKKHVKILLTGLITVFILLGFAVPVNMVGNWYQQFMPNLFGRSVTDVFFLDSLTGWAVTNATNQNPDTTYVLKTTNRGDNWVIQYRKIQTGGGFSGYFRVYFLNQNTGYVCDVKGFDKTSNGGANWISLNAPLNAYLDASILNTDSIWLVSPDQLTGGVFRTTDSGTSWTQQLNLGSQNPVKIYMYNGSTGYIAKNTGSSYIRKTTNSGLNWDTMVNGEGFLDIRFVNSLTGWKANGTMKKTTNGGLNWVQQTVPFGGNLIGNALNKFSLLNADTLWGIGGEIITGSQTRGIIYRTIDGGQNWLFQVPDTSIYVPGPYSYMQFTDSRNGWAYTLGFYGGVHTTNGGDPIWLTGIKQISSQIPKEFRLYQNYPNPFNPGTIIKYQIVNNKYQKKANVILEVFDVTGKELVTLVNEEQSAGTYEVDFSGTGYSSGVYFYSLIIDGKVIDTKKMLLIK